ncbi:MAG TPA: DUF1684 domain-containing protein, partial [Bacteroidales bacterium]|nr:DUF1684 domain-containing protein [Bacteroidales bacterium]
TIGSDSSNSIVFPPGAPAFAGSIIKSGAEITYIPDRKKNVSTNNKAVTGELQLETDMSQHPTLLEAGSFAWFIIKRDDQYGIRLRNFNHPRINELKHIPAYPPDLHWRIEAAFVPFNKDSVFEVPTMIGGTEDYTCPGKLEFSVDGTKTELFPFDTGDGFFIIFGDATSGKETYAAGRFLSTGKPDSHNHVIIDFNKAYNPPCAFSPFATCPLPPPENRLQVAIKAGEKAVHLE